MPTKFSILQRLYILGENLFLVQQKTWLMVRLFDDGHLYILRHMQTLNFYGKNP